MHAESRAYLTEAIAGLQPKSVLDIGARHVNGTIRDMFPDVRYVPLDISPGENVEVVADAADWEPDAAYDLVVCMSVFEHAPRWRDIIATVRKALRPGGTFVLTTHCDPYPVHGAGGGPGDGPYANLTPDELREAFAGFLLDDLRATPAGDLLATARRY